MTVPPAGRGERGVGLMEVVVATLIAVGAVLTLATTFGMGRGLVNRYEIARVALGAAQRRMEVLSALPADTPELALGRHPASGTFPVPVDGQPVVAESWQVDAWDDPANGANAGSADLRKVTVTVSWGQSGPAETLTLTRLFPVP